MKVMVWNAGGDRHCLRIGPEDFNPKATRYYLFPRQPSPLVIDRLSDWVHDTKPNEDWVKEGRSRPMQVTYCIELKFDVADREKLPVMKQKIQQAGRMLLATANLMADQSKPQIAIFSDDFYIGREDIELLPDDIATGMEQTAATDNGDSDKISQDLLDAFKGD